MHPEIKKFWEDAGHAEEHYGNLIEEPINIKL
jgi:hypothetical protein